MEKVLITGIGGGLGRLLGRRLLGSWSVCGVDLRGWPTAPPEVTVHRADLRKRAFQEALRKEQPDAVVHLGFVRDFQGDPRKRHDINVRGTQALLRHCAELAIPRLVVVSSGTVYGARPDNPFYLVEDHPLSASRDYPEIRDLVEVDTLVTSFLWRAPEVKTALLRPAHVLGPYSRAMMAEYLRLPRPPSVLGFDPVMQFLHEEDLVEAVIRSLEIEDSGVYNVAGAGQVPLHTAIRETGGRAMPIPEPLLRPALGRLFGWGMVPWPQGAIDFLKYPVTLSGAAFEAATDFAPLFGLEETLESVRSA